MQERMYMFRKKIQAASGSFQYRRPTQPSPTFSARTMRSAQSALPANRTHSHVFWKLRGTWHTHSHVPIVRQVRQVRHSLPTPCALRNVLCQPEGMCFAFFWTPCTGIFYPLFCALRFGISGAHSPHIALCPSSVQIRTSPYKSVFPCPHPVPCAMCFSRLKKLQKKVEKNGFCSILSL